MERTKQNGVNIETENLPRACFFINYDLIQINKLRSIHKFVSINGNKIDEISQMSSAGFYKMPLILKAAENISWVENKL